MRPPRIHDVIDYLRVRGWTVTGGWRGAQIWSLDDYDVLVPPSDTLPDTAIRLRELIRCVADAEGRAVHDIRRDIAMPGVDLLRYGAMDPSTPVTLPMGARAVDAVRELVVVCAREVVDNDGRPSTGRLPEPVRELLNRSLLSLRAEVFGVEVALPLEESDPASLGRMTALRALHYSTAVRDAVESADADAPEQLASRGLSEAGCDAVAELAGPDRDVPFELGFRWSRWVPRAAETVTFPNGSAAFTRTADSADASADTGYGAVRGLVTSLTDDADGDRLRIKVRGILEIDGAPTGRARSVTVRLATSHDYATALAAHRDGRVVRAHGAVTGSARTRVITTAENGLTVTDDPSNTQ